MKALLQTLAVTVLGLAAAVAQGADWTLDNAASRVSFVTIKSNHTAEVHHFATLAGAVGAGGEATLVIDLASVATAIPIRDERMRELLFETGLYPRATFTTRVDVRQLRALPVGESLTTSLEGDLDLHGETRPLAAEVVITRLNRGGIQVATRSPVLVDAANHALVAGVEKLREVAGLPSIGRTVPVTFVLTYRR